MMHRSKIRLAPRKPHALFWRMVIMRAPVPCDEMYSSATPGGYGHRPAVLEISESLTRESPDSPTTVLKQRRRSIVRQPTCFTEDRNLSVLPPGQTILSANPNAPIRGCERGVTSIAGSSKSENIRPESVFVRWSRFHPALAKQPPSLAV